MADIAFLLLIFFLVTTTINVDKGLSIKLPPWPEEPPPPSEIKDRNTFIILVNSRDQMLAEGEYTDVKDLKGMVKEFIDNPYKKTDLAESSQKAVVSFKSDRGTSYGMYIQVLNEIKAAYHQLWDVEAVLLFGKEYNDLVPVQKRAVRKKYPMKLSEAEPEAIGVS